MPSKSLKDMQTKNYFDKQYALIKHPKKNIEHPKKYIEHPQIKY